MLVDEPRLTDLIGIPALRSLLADAERLSGLRACVLDAEGNLLPECDAAGALPLFCRLGRETAHGAAHCRRRALRAAFQAAGQQHAYLYHCHPGITYIAVGLTVGSTFLGTLLVGPALCAPLDAAALQALRGEAVALGVGEDDLLAAVHLLPALAEDKLRACARLLAGALTARTEAGLHDRAGRAVRLRLEALIRELCTPRLAAPPGYPALPPTDQQVVDAWEASDPIGLAGALRHLAAALAPDWSHQHVLVRVRLLDLLTALARHSDHGCVPGEVRDALIPFATMLLGVRAWQEVEGLLGDLSRELGRFLRLPAARPSDPRIDRVVRFLRGNFQRDLPLPEVAHSVGLSTQYFCSLFKEQIGCSYVQYLRRIRLDHARDLLSKTALEVTEVAFESGFNDVTYFGQIFKAAEGLTPSQYRRQGGWVRYLPPSSPSSPGVPAGAPRSSRLGPLYEGP